MSKLPPLNAELDLQIERIIPTPRSKVFEAWTTPALLKEWFCPAPWRVTEAEVDLRAGGNFYTLMKGPNPGEENHVRGCFLEVVKNEKLVWTDALLADYRPSGNAFVTGMVLLEDHPEGTKYTARACHKDAETKKMHVEMGFEYGWNATLDQLIALMKNK